ncbi:hypothetical protein JXA85_08640, partial [Candidatus Woesearchaeota archaeon]|nr:hypothetical protein [Candidatus Woesearchaeota archaeon]
QTSVTHIIIYAFRNVNEYENYFKILQTRLGDLIEIKETFIISPKSVLKSSYRELFHRLLEDYEKEEMIKPEIQGLVEQ